MKALKILSNPAHTITGFYTDTFVLFIFLINTYFLLTMHVLRRLLHKVLTIQCLFTMLCLPTYTLVIYDTTITTLSLSYLHFLFTTVSGK